MIVIIMMMMRIIIKTLRIRRHFSSYVLPFPLLSKRLILACFCDSLIIKSFHLFLSEARYFLRIVIGMSLKIN